MGIFRLLAFKRCSPRQIEVIAAAFEEGTTLAAAINH